MRQPGTAPEFSRDAPVFPVESPGLSLDEPGFSLLELLVATLCTTLIAAGVFSLLVSGAAGARRGWSRLSAQTSAEAAVAALALDLPEAGLGLERAGVVMLGGTRVPLLSSTANGLRLLRGAGPALEIAASSPGFRYEVASAGGLRRDDVVVAIDLPGRPPGAPLPAGIVVAVFSLGGGSGIAVSWGIAEAAMLDAWGEPRALLPVRAREYALRPGPQGAELRRRDDDGSWQPVAERLDAFEIAWLLDGDGDGVVDRSAATIPAGAESSVCAVELRAVVAPARARALEAGTARRSPPVEAHRTVRAGRCAG